MHGHSYTANPLGCQAAVTALNMYYEAAEDAEKREEATTSLLRSRLRTAGKTLLPEPWGEGAAERLSLLPGVQRAICLGTVLAAELDAGGAAGYEAASDSALVCDALRRGGSGGGVFARPLGNVVYVMASPLSDAATCAGILGQLEDAIVSVTVGQEEDAAV